MSHKVGTKGQLVIEKRIRDELGVEVGSLAVQERVGDHLEVRFYPPEHDRSLLGVLKDSVRRRPRPDQSWEEIREEGWAAAAREREEEHTGR